MQTEEEISVIKSEQVTEDSRILCQEIGTDSHKTGHSCSRDRNFTTDIGFGTKKDPSNKDLLAEVNSRQVRIILERCDADSGLRSENHVLQKRKAASTAASTMSFFHSSVARLRSSELSSPSREPFVKKKCKKSGLENGENERGDKTKTRQNTKTYNHVSSAGLKLASLAPALTLNSLATIPMKKNLDRRRDVAVQMLFVMLEENLVGFVGWKTVSKNLTDELTFQCLYCPSVKNSAMNISDHVKNEHSDVFFLTRKKAPLVGGLLYMMCSHCEYVGVDSNSVWVHFAVCHNVPGILSTAAPNSLDPPPKLTLILNQLSFAKDFPFYKCVTCTFVAADPRFVAEHSLCCSSQECRSGLCAVVVKVVRPVKGLRNNTYKELAENTKFSDLRSEIFVCLRCSYTSFCRIFMLEHHVRTHSGKAMVFRCLDSNCLHRTTLPGDMVKHLKQSHFSAAGSSVVKMCSVTLVENGKDGICECV